MKHKLNRKKTGNSQNTARSGGKNGVDWKKQKDIHRFRKNGGDALIRPALIMLFGERGDKKTASFVALSPLRKKASHLDEAVVRVLVGGGYVRVASSKATSCELTRIGRKALGLENDSGNEHGKLTAQG